VAEVLQERAVDVLLLISTKDVDQRGVRGLVEVPVERLPAVGLESGKWKAFVQGFIASYRQARALFRIRPPRVVLAMGSFTSVPPVLAGRVGRAPSFLHEANAVAGRANRWLAPLVREAFIYFPRAAERLWNPHIRVTGMPVRSQFQFQAAEAAGCRLALGLRPDDPVLLVTGGSQGAHGLNEAVLRAAPSLRRLDARLQVLHLTGAADCEAAKRAYAASGMPAVVRPFLSEMELALGAASVAISRAGASSLAEAAAMRLPTLLVPLPSAVDNHQLHNARDFVETGAARMVAQAEATPARLIEMLWPLLNDARVIGGIRESLTGWHRPDAARVMADTLMAAIDASAPALGPAPSRAVRGSGAPLTEPLPSPVHSPRLGAR
jgi:UDP-N-acetylglucosamine--N-acetylmuramyl-(pentapeptide) pyrophosphoryl-undecaprenol N-acetylglucosamine transferase